MEGQISEADAKLLIEALKRLVDSGTIAFPAPGTHKDVIVETLLSENNQFIISIAPGARDLMKCTYQIRTKPGNVVLMRLDLVSDIVVHQNPDKTIVSGPHLHVYKEDYGVRFAVEFNVKNRDLVDNCLEFFRMLNVVEPKPIPIAPNLFC